MAYVIKRGDSLSRIARKHGVTLVALLAANPRYKADPNRVSVGDRVEIPGKTPGGGSKKVAKKKKTKTTRAPATGGPFVVPFGQLTFDAEGMEKRGPYFSRVVHVPGSWSGVTIGRGYDMSERSANEIKEDLMAAGVAQRTAARLAEARGLRGSQAKKFIADNDLKQIEITPKQQKALFLITYQELEGDVIRICTKADVVQKYGRSIWEELHAPIRDVLVDLRYRGDYTGATREVVQPPTVENDLEAFKAVIADRGYWVGSRKVPTDRFERRKKFLGVA